MLHSPRSHPYLHVSAPTTLSLAYTGIHLLCDVPKEKHHQFHHDHCVPSKCLRHRRRSSSPGIARPRAQLEELVRGPRRVGFRFARFLGPCPKAGGRHLTFFLKHERYLSLKVLKDTLRRFSEKNMMQKEHPNIPIKSLARMRVLVDVQRELVEFGSGFRTPECRPRHLGFW